MDVLKITKDTDDKALYILLGDVRYNNFTELYNRLKNDEDLHPVFKSDYLSGEKLDKWFVQEFTTQEPQWNLINMIDDDDYIDLIQRINDGYSMGGFVLAQVDSITDKHYRDGCH
jgi:hypothetical protein